MSDLNTKILDLIAARPGLKARQIAEALGVSRTEVNAALYGGLRGRVEQDPAYRWRLRGQTAPNTGAVGAARRVDLRTPLARLSRYYLDCLNQDDGGGVSEFASSRYGDAWYCELDALPLIDPGVNPFASQAVRQLLNRAKRDRDRQSLIIGYPVRLHHVRSRRSNWEGFKIEPLLLFHYRTVDASGNPQELDELPQINFEALRWISNAGDTGLMEEAIQLADELGLGNANEDLPDLDELFARLQEIRSEWDWVETVDPLELSGGAPLSDLNTQGIYNRAVLVAAERSPYTKGLETELAQLQSFDEARLQNTALGQWLTGAMTPAAQPGRAKNLLEVIPLNTEQRQAVRQALSNPLTVITGPPGTGKSQVVTSILINAAWRGHSVLFASKNNKAVDVVETRVNDLGPRPILLRLGAGGYQAKVADYITALLAATATPGDRQEYAEHEVVNATLQRQGDDIQSEIDALVELRNAVDAQEAAVEEIRSEVGEAVFSSARTAVFPGLEAAAATLQEATDAADRSKQGLWHRLVWPLVRRGRYQNLTSVAEKFHDIGAELGISAPGVGIGPATLGQWIQYPAQVKARIAQLRRVQSYFQQLGRLNEARPLEELNRLQLELVSELSRNSESLWRAWLRLQPSRLDAAGRRLLGNYSALLNLIIAADAQNQRAGGDVFRRLNQLFPQIASILACWAVTSLSARGRVPFEPGFFDLLIIDEASQCDIASALPLLFRAKRTVIIGDPMQLRHISTLSRQQDQQLLSKHELLENHATWAYSTRSLFDLASTVATSEDLVQLRDHHRSHADIVEFSNSEFYEGRLRVATNYDRLRCVSRTEPAVRWVSVTGEVTRPGNGGALNEAEAREVVSELQRLVLQGYTGSVGVVSPFRAQANRIRDLVNQDGLLSTRLGQLDFLADTVHKFQGDERDLMIFSPVVSSGTPRGAVGFLRNNANLFNVAVTRARAALVVVGDQAAALHSDVEYLSRFAVYVARLGDEPAESALQESVDLGPEYPNVLNPTAVSDWERAFYPVLYRAGIRAIPQYSVEKYCLDFAVLLGERRLNIEIDGERYHRNWDGELCRRDQIRNQRLIELGWDVMRFWVYQIRDDESYCVERVKAWVSNASQGLFGQSRQNQILSV